MDSQAPHQQTQPQATDLGTSVFIWVFALAAFLLIPICATDYRRRMCLRRLKERRWNVSVEGETDEWPRSTNRHQGSPEGEEDKPNDQLSKQEEEEIRQLFLIEILKDYSKPLSKDDIRRKSKQLNGIDILDGSKSESVDASTASIDKVTSESLTPGCAEADGRLPNDSIRSLPSCLSPGIDDMESIIVVPLSGATRPLSSEVETREVPNGCSICYCEYGVDETVTWSANPACGHVFHEDCALTWFMAVGKKELRRRRRAGIEPSNPDPVEQVKDFPILCPCCRQTFASAVKEDPNSTKDALSDCPTSRTVNSCPSTTDEEPRVFGDENV